MKRANPFWSFFCSVKLTVVILLALALTSIIGTIVPQNESPDAYLHAYGAFRYQLFDALGIFDMYHAWWFQGLLVLLTVNIVICSIERLSGTWKLIFNREPTVRPERFSNRPDARSFTDKRDLEALVAAYEPVIARRFGRCTVTREPDQAVIYAEKGRLSRLGVYIVHLSVIFLLVGGLVGSFFGFEGYVNIPEGEAVDTIRIRNSGAIHRLNFQIRCDDFDMTLYPNGAPKEYRSSLSIIEAGQTVLQKDIVVNDPLRYRGINIFQSSYGKLPPAAMPAAAPAPAEPSESYTLSVTSRSSGMAYTVEAAVGAPVALPEGLGTFVVMSYEADAEFRGMDVGASVKGIITPADGEPEEILLPLKFANFDKMRGGSAIIAVVNSPADGGAPAAPAEVRYYTGLQVTRDPGVWLVYTGFILMIAGCFVAFYLSHQQVCLVIDRLRKNSRVTFAGTANRNKLAMKNVVDKIHAALTER